MTPVREEGREIAVRSVKNSDPDRLSGRARSWLGIVRPHRTQGPQYSRPPRNVACENEWRLVRDNEDICTGRRRANRLSLGQQICRPSCGWPCWAARKTCRLGREPTTTANAPGRPSMGSGLPPARTHADYYVPMYTPARHGDASCSTSMQFRALLGPRCRPAVSRISFFCVCVNKFLFSSPLKPKNFKDSTSH